MASLAQIFWFAAGLLPGVVAAFLAIPSPPATTMTTAATAAATNPTTLERQVRDDLRDAQAWLTLANNYRWQREFEKARAAFKQVIEQKRMTADGWADYADALRSLDGGLTTVTFKGARLQ